MVYMKSNPGGQVDPQNLIGRDQLIKEIWDTLEQQSVVMTAERRIGKTSIMQKMQAEPKEKWIPIYQDLEKYSSAQEFAQSVYEILKTYQNLSKTAENYLQNLRQALAGFKFGDIEIPEAKDIPWQKLLTSSITDLVTDPDWNKYKLVFLWDEIPYMLSNIKNKEGEEVAKQILDILRSLRQEQKNFRIVMTGSIGLHHVIIDLKEKGYSTAPINDMYTIEVNPLHERYAKELAKKLITGENITIEGEVQEEVISTLVEQTDAFPYYIHHIIKTLKTATNPITKETVEEVVKQQLTNSDDPWQLRHFEERLPTYYEGEDKIAKLILDELAVQDSPQSVKDMQKSITSQTALKDLEQLRKLLRLMAQDHYLNKNTDNKYSFRFSLIKRWWKLERDL